MRRVLLMGANVENGPDEEWRDIPGYEGRYQASSLGNIRRVGKNRNRVLTPTQDGYLCLILTTPGAPRECVRVHRAVCMAFHGTPPPGKPFALHGNGIKTDNRATNLRWGNAVENAKDAIKHGAHPGASMTHCLRGHPLPAPNHRGKRNCNDCARHRRRAGLPDGSDRHGTRGGYVSGCRCASCTKANSDYAFARKHRGK